MKARFPWFTLCTGTVVLALGLSPSWSEALQLERTALDHHEHWRLLGAHLTHWTAGHLACELAAFLACGWFVEHHSRSRMISMVLASMLCVSVAVLAYAPQIGTYRGLSGINAALFVAAVVELIRRATAARSRLASLLAGGAMFVLAGKTIVELAVAQQTMVEASTDSAPVPVAHLAGIIVGFCIALLPQAQIQARSPTLPRFTTRSDPKIIGNSQ